MYYISALEKTISYIEEHLNQPFTLLDLEEVNHFSRCHFSKLFHLLTGYHISEYIRLRRLSVACERLVNSETKIIEIAMDLQFASQDVFTRSFTKSVGISPGKYRKNKVYDALLNPLDVNKIIWIQGGMEMKPEIIELEPMRVIGLEYYGKNENYEIPQLWQAFLPRVNEIEGNIKPNWSLGVCEPLEEKVEDVDLDHPNAFKYLACVIVDETSEVPEDMTAWKVEHRKYAVFTHTGSVEFLGDTYKAIYSKWLPESGYQVEFTYDFEVYDENFRPGSEDSKMYIYIPIKNKR
ncbi:MAG: AraC family transcriptional regulator [Clostridia bacterium]|nr:AraC family transcriptional regulator [Clostridia bacterium]